MAFEVSTTRGMEIAVIVPSSGIDTWKSDRSSSRNASNSSSARSTSSIRSTGGVDAPDGGEKRPLEQIVFRKDVLLDSLRVFARAFTRLDGEELALIVPLVERGVLVEALVALEPDQLGPVDFGERLGDLGLADARLAFDQQRPAEEIHQPQRGRKIAVGDIADLGEASGDVFAGQGHGRSSATALPCQNCRHARLDLASIP